LEWFGFSDNEASWLHWFLYYKFYFDNGLLPKDEYSEKNDDYINKVIDAWAVYYSEDIAIVSRKPKVERNSIGFLHSDTEPAVSFKDGYKLYYLNGVKFPKELWEKVVNKKLSLKEIMNIDDIDQRTQAMKYVAVEDLLKQFNAETLDTYKKETLDGTEVNYKLVKIPAHKDLFTIDSYHAIYNCPSTNKIYMSGIAPEIGEKEDIKLAMAWKSQVKVEDFINMIPLKHES